MPRLTINGHPQQVDVDPDTPLLWVLRDTLGLTGTRYGCGIAQCGACTVHVDGVATRSCSMPVSSAEGAQITRSKACRRMVVCIRCRKRGSPMMSRNVAIARAE